MAFGEGELVFLEGVTLVDQLCSIGSYHTQKYMNSKFIGDRLLHFKKKKKEDKNKQL